MGPVWQVEQGALRLDRVSREGARFVQLALPGDLLGLEVLAALPYAYSVRAVVPSRVRPRALSGDSERRLAMMEGLLQQQARIEELVSLRTGPAQDRMKHLILLLAPEDAAGWQSDEAHRALPTIKDMAAIIDTAPETVSRIFANLKRTQLLDSRQRQGASFSLARLRESAWPTGMTRSDGGLRLRASMA